MSKSSKRPERPPTDVASLLRTAAGERKVGRAREADLLCEEALRLDADNADALHILALNRLDAGDARAAGTLLERAIRAHSDVANLHVALGAALLVLSDFDGAIAGFRRALALRPDDARVHSNLAAAQYDAGRFEEAIATLMSALRSKPADADLRFHLSLALLKTGRFEAGWPEYEFRPACRVAERAGLPARWPQWRGEDAPGKTVLLYGEQGFGDTLQFVRYAPLVAARGARVVLLAQRELLPLLVAAPGVSHVMALDDPLPPVDSYCLLGSLPLVFGTAADSIPATVPYLAPPPERVERWRRRFSGDDGFRVGVVWAGNPRHRDDRNRSLPPAALEPLGGIAGVTLYSLQKGAAAARSAESGLELVQLGDELQDFADTAAALAQLDLVVSVDTAVAHLAGALGRPVLTLLSTAGDWRWLTGREDSPWYPTMRLIRQSAPGDWVGVIERTASEIASRVAAGRRDRQHV